MPAADRAAGTGDLARRPITSGAVWRADNVGASASWTYVLGEPARDAIVDAVERMRARGVTIDSVVRSDLDDAGLAPLVAQWAHELQQVRAFVLIQGRTTPPRRAAADG